MSKNATVTSHLAYRYIVMGNYILYDRPTTTMILTIIIKPLPELNKKCQYLPVNFKQLLIVAMECRGKEKGVKSIKRRKEGGRKEEEMGNAWIG